MPRPPIRIDRVLDRPERIGELLRANGPYWPVYRYFSGTAELRASGAPVDDLQAPMQVPPWFRGDWAQSEPLVAGIEPILRNSAFFRAARELYGLSDRAVIRPQLVYVNLMLPMPAADRGHLDVPAFRGIGRDRYPVWLLAAMGHSGLFEPWRIRIATAVSWWYGGSGGEFTCWPDGPDGDPVVIAPRSNTALVGENECMFHRVERIGTAQALDGLTTEAELVAEGGDWSVRQRGRRLARVAFEDVRISVSWKAEVFANPGEARAVDAHLDDLDIGRVLESFAADLEVRGLGGDADGASLANDRFVSRLGEVYTRTPTRFPEL